MKQLFVILMAAFLITACKKSENNQTTITNVQATDTAKVIETPVVAEQPKLIEVGNADAESFATEYDSNLKALEEANAKKDKAAVMALKAKFVELDKAKAEKASKLSGKELETYNGFLEKRSAAAQDIISAY